MSSILKALKKLENDTSSCKRDLLKIDAKILHDSSSARMSSSAVLIIAIALFTGGGGAMFFYLRHNGNNITERTPGFSIQSNDENRIITTAPQLLTPTAPSSFKEQSQSQSHTIPTRSTPPSQPEKLKDSAPPHEAPSHPKAITGVAKPVLTLNGIAFQDGGSENLAVINGNTISRGSMIEGLRVEEILKDRVTLSEGDKKFDIILNKSDR